MIGVTFWKVKPGATTQTIVSVEEGTVEVSNAADPFDIQRLRPGQRITSTQGMLFGIEAIPTPTIPAGRKPPVNRALISAASQNQTNSTKGIVQSATAEEKEQYWIAGYVQTEQGQPILGAKILLHNLEGINEGQLFLSEENGHLVGKTITDHRGYYTIHIEKPLKFLISSIPTSDYLALREEVELTEANKTRVKHFIHPEAKLHIKGTVVDSETEKPIEGAEVGVIIKKHDEKYICAEMAKSGVDGTFFINRLVEGVYRLEAMAEGYVRFNPYQKENNEFLNVSISKQNQEKEYIVKMKPGFAATVIVQDSRKNPLADTEILFIRNSDTLQDAGWGKTNARGIHTNTELPKEPLVAHGKKKGYGSEISQVFQPGPQDNPTQITLTLTVSGFISGSVTDANGKPVKTRTVFAEFLDLADWKNILYEQTKTDEVGLYCIEDLSPGNYRIAISKDDWLPNAEQSKEVELQEGEQKTGVDFIVNSEAGEARGKVVDSNEKPLSGVRVSAFISKGNESLGGSSAVTGENGEFLIEKLPEGDVIQFHISEKNYVDLFQHESFPVDYTVLTLRMKGSLIGTVTTMKREPIANATVWPRSSMGRAISDLAVRTQADGSFRMENLNAGLYKFGIGAEGYTDIQTEDILIREGETTDAGFIILDKGSTLSGIITNPNGAPVGGAAIAMQSKVVRMKPEGWSNEAERYIDPAQYAETTSNPDGSFQIAHFPTSGETLLIMHPQFAPKIVPISPDTLRDSRIAITMTLGGSLEGSVRDAQGNPQVGAFIRTVHKPDELFSSLLQTDKNGSFRLDRLLPGSYTVIKMNKPNTTFRDMDSKNVVVEEGRTTRCDFGSGEGTKVYGIAYQNGQPKAGVYLTLIRFAADYVDQLIAYSNEGGEYSFQGLEPGRYRLNANGNTNNGFFDSSDEILINEFNIEESQKEIRIDAVLTVYEIRVLAIDADTGEPIPGVIIHSKESIYAPFVYTGIGIENKTGNDGSLTFRPQGSGHYEFTAMKEGYIHADFSADLPKPALDSMMPPVTVEVRLRKQDATMLVALRSDNRPMDRSASIRFFWMQNGVRYELPFVFEPETGLYKLSGITEGDAELSVEASVMRQRLISLPQPVSLQKGETVRLDIDLLDSNIYVIHLETPDKQIVQPPIYYEILDFPQPIRQGIPAISQSNVINLSLPKGPYRIRLFVPGYQPSEFVPDSMAEKPGRIEYAPYVREMALQLIAQ